MNVAFGSFMKLRTGDGQTRKAARIARRIIHRLCGRVCVPMDWYLANRLGSGAQRPDRHFAGGCVSSRAPQNNSRSLILSENHEVGS